MNIIFDTKNRKFMLTGVGGGWVVVDVLVFPGLILSSSPGLL